jgi:hypothetical protein
MNSIAEEGFAVTVSVPRSHVGQAELRVGPDAVTLITRPIRHYRAIISSFIAACTVLVLIGGVFSWSGQHSLKDPGLTGPARTTALLMSDGAPVLVGVLGAVLGGGMALVLRRSGGDPRSMTLPITSVKLVKHKGRVLVLSAAFDVKARSRSWSLAARSRDDAKAIASALTTGGG